MILRFLTFIFFVLMFLSSCSTQYRIGNISSHSMLDPKPNSEGKAIYIGGNYSTMTSEYDFSPNPKANSIEFLEAQISLGNSLESSFSSIGAFTFAGLYNARALNPEDITVPVEAGKKWFAGVGIDYEYGHRIRLKDFDIRTVGLKTNLFYENGSYSRFRQNAANASKSTDESSYSRSRRKRIMNSNPLGIGVNILATHELIYLNRSSSYGINLVYGLGSGLFTGAIGLTYSNGPMHFSINTHGNIDGAFINAGIRFHLP